MKSAKEIFEELGYKYQYDKKEQIIICSYEDWSINFEIESEMIGFCNMGRYCELTNDDIQAINKQVEELGWNK